MRKIRDDSGLVRAGELFAEMGISIPIPTRKNMRLIEAAEDIQNNPVEDITYQHTVLCQTSLPYRSTVERTWERRNGKVILFMEAGSALDPVKERYVELPLPFGPKARLILLYLNTMAIKTQSRVIEAENSMTAFIRQLQNGREPNGDEVRKFQQQLRSLAKARINLGVLGDERSFDGKLDVVDNFDIWFPKNPNQRVLWTNTVELSQKYFETLINHAVPLDPRAIAALSHSSMALDIYSWLAQRLHRIPGNNSALVAWTTLQQQLGDNYKEIRMFRRTFLKTLKDVLTQYPEARLDTNERGLLLKNSPPPVRKKLVQISGL
jgi:hypothetical protein